MTTSTISKAEQSYIQSGLALSPPQRLDGRSLTDYRAIALETGVAPLANGSAKVNIGRDAHDGSGGTEVVGAVKLEVETVEESGASAAGRVVVGVTCSPSAYPSLSSPALEDLQHDLTTLLHTTLSHPSLHPQNLTIIPNKKHWVLHLDLVVLADAGNVYDALFMAAKAALWDTKVPRTRSVEYKTKKPSTTVISGKDDGMDVDDTAGGGTSGFDTRELSRATDFELPDYWDEGEVLEGRERWPVAVTINVDTTTHFLDATSAEEAAISQKLLLIFSIETSKVTLRGMRLFGPNETNAAEVRKLVESGQGYAGGLANALTAKLKAEDLRRGVKAREHFEKDRR